MIHIPAGVEDHDGSNDQSTKTNTKKKVIGPSRVSIYVNDSTQDIRYASKDYLTKVINNKP